jgi:GxxExxY protein
LGAFYEVYNELGHGFLESVYQDSLIIGLGSKGLQVLTPVDIQVWFRGVKLGKSEGDILVEKSVLLELKAARTLDSAHQAQLLNYLRATDIEVGLLLNFGLKPEVKRLLFDNVRKATREKPKSLIAELLKSDNS